MKIHKAGIATIQDHGRTGYRKWGICESGYMDPTTAALVNILAGNTLGSPTIEILSGEFFASSAMDLLVACGGKGFNAFINDRPLNFWQPVLLKANESIRLIPAGTGIVYLAVHGGLLLPPMLGSRSTNLVGGLGGYEGRGLRKGDELPTSMLCNSTGEKIAAYLNSNHNHVNIRLSITAVPDYYISSIRFVPGPEFLSFTDASHEILVSEEFELTGMVNRMGYRLKGTPLQYNSSEEIISTAVVPGTMQVSPDGQVTILMRDAQTTGGYPRIGQVIDVDLPHLAQQDKVGQVKFKAVNINEAEGLLLKREEQLRRLQNDYNLYFE